MSFAIISDSTADLTNEECERLGITIVPLTVDVGGGIYKDQYEITTEEFYDKMIAADGLPKTSQPSPSEFIETYNKLAANNEKLLSLHISNKLSGTIQSAALAADQVEAEVEVIDTLSATAGQGLNVIYAAELAQAGVPADEAVKRIKDAIATTHFFIACGTLDNLLQGGRLSAEEVDQATLLDIKPMITVDNDGILRNIDKAKGFNGIIRKYVEQLEAITDVEGPQRVRFCHTRNEKGIEKLKAALEEAKVEYEDYGTCSCGAIVATHIGMKALGFGCVPVSACKLD